MNYLRTAGGLAGSSFLTGPLLLVTLLPWLAGCHPKQPPAGNDARTNAAAASPAIAATHAGTPDPLRLILLPVNGDSRLDHEIAAAQQAVRRGGKKSDATLEHLGWLFVAKARVSFDPGFYKLAEQTALCLESREPHSLEALLLRGHVLDNLHQFKQAEPLARELVARRGLAFDYGLLGDVLMEQGRLDEAVAAYQKMADLKPDIHVYTRAAHIRWLKGDLMGAISAMQMALQATTPRDPETAAWVYTRMALYQLQQGQIEKGLAHCDVALEFQKNYPPALLTRGKLLLASGRNEEAVKALSQAEVLNPLPEYQWTLLEALRVSGKTDVAVEHDLQLRGEMTDPRTYALYLATRGEDAVTALRLAKAELESRQDVFTHDAVAWAYFAIGQSHAAEVEIEMALAAGTQDARMFYHAGVIKEKLGQHPEAAQMFAKAREFQTMLLPSERAELAGHASKLALNSAETGKAVQP